MQHLPALFRQYGRPRRFPAGTQIFQKDAPAEEIFYLERGKVRAYLLYPDGAERTLCFVERGNLVGEEAVARPPVRIVCVDAVTDLLMYSMDADQLLRGCMEQGERLVDDVIAQTGLPAGKLLSLLTMLELKGVVRRLPGKRIALQIR